MLPWTDSTNWIQWVTQRVKRKRKKERRMGEGRGEEGGRRLEVGRAI